MAFENFQGKHFCVVSALLVVFVWNILSAAVRTQSPIYHRTSHGLFPSYNYKEEKHDSS